MDISARIVVRALPVALIVAFGLGAEDSSSTSATGLPMEGAEAEEFLRTAEILDCSETLRFVQDESGKSRGGCLAVLSDGATTVRAVSKKHDNYVHRAVQISGERVIGWRDSYRHEIATYELDKLLGLDLVPPCVERGLRGNEGSLCMWIEGAMSEWERTTKYKTHPPDLQDWNSQVQAIQLFEVLINDLGNPWCILIDGNWKLYKVHSARAFHDSTKVVNERNFQPSLRVLDALRELDDEEVRTNLAPWLTKKHGRVERVEGRIMGQNVDPNGRLMTAPRAGVPFSCLLRGAVLDNVGRTATGVRRCAGTQHCQGGHPRGAPRGEGASTFEIGPGT
jgi:hypothetical protein